MSDPHADRRPGTSLWANHDWTLLWASRAVSGLGSRATDVAYPLLVFALTRSAVRAGAVVTVSELALLAGSLAGGVWIDRVASVRVIPPERMEDSMRLQQARASGTALAGPALAGVLFSIPAALPFLADGISYAATFVAGLRLRVSLALEAAGKKPSGRTETATAGLSWLASHPTVAAVAASLAFFTFVSSGCQVLVILLARGAGASSSEVGAALAVAALALTSGWLGLGLFYAIVVALEPAVSVVVFTKLTLATPDALRGRVSSLLHLLTSLFAVLAPLTAGALIEACGTTAPALLAIPGLASAVLLTTTPALRRFVAQEPSSRGSS
ncbi:MAG: hypothetical protein M0T77_00320 [Actinomycetota bacterium]|nr:hypothetical protein [Actinomycetota bacterium]